MLLKKLIIDRSSVVIQNPLLRSCLSTWKLLPQQSGGFSRFQSRGLLTATTPFQSLRQPSVPLFAIHTSIRRFAATAAAAPGQSPQDRKKTVEEEEMERINKEKEKEREKEGQQREKERTAIGGRIVPSKYMVDDKNPLSPFQLYFFKSCGGVVSSWRWCIFDVAGTFDRSSADPILS